MSTTEPLVESPHIDASVCQVMVGASCTAVGLDTNPVRYGPAVLQAALRRAPFRPTPGKRLLTMMRENEPMSCFAEGGK